MASAVRREYFAVPLFPQPAWPTSCSRQAEEAVSSARADCSSEWSACSSSGPVAGLTSACITAAANLLSSAPAMRPIHGSRTIRLRTRPWATGQTATGAAAAPTLCASSRKQKRHIHAASRTSRCASAPTHASSAASSALAVSALPTSAPSSAAPAAAPPSATSRAVRHVHAIARSAAARSWGCTCAAGAAATCSRLPSTATGMSAAGLGQNHSASGTPNAASASAVASEPPTRAEVSCAHVVGWPARTGDVGPRGARAACGLGGGGASCEGCAFSLPSSSTSELGGETAARAAGLGGARAGARPAGAEPAGVAAAADAATVAVAAAVTSAADAGPSTAAAAAPTDTTAAAAEAAATAAGSAKSAAGACAVAAAVADRCACAGAAVAGAAAAASWAAGALACALSAAGGRDTDSFALRSTETTDCGSILRLASTNGLVPWVLFCAGAGAWVEDAAAAPAPPASAWLWTGPVSAVRVGPASSACLLVHAAVGEEGVAASAAAADWAGEVAAAARGGAEAVRAAGGGGAPVCGFLGLACFSFGFSFGFLLASSSGPEIARGISGDEAAAAACASILAACTSSRSGNACHGSIGPVRSRQTPCTRRSTLDLVTSG
mmetsp:Transcript_1866/g.4954  ORF Transcript_1866/g.4954 Transcript_1866/m.4954 type:complete len:612 (+) Transcript_1866:309-2144(+)